MQKETKSIIKYIFMKKKIDEFEEKHEHLKCFSTSISVGRAVVAYSTALLRRMS